MLTYITRRALVLDPGHPDRVVPAVLGRARDLRSVRASSARRRDGAATSRAAATTSTSTTRSSCSTAAGSATRSQGDLGQSERTNDSVSTTITDGHVVHRAADLLGDPRLGDPLDRRSASTRRSSSTRSATTCSPALSFIGLAMPPFWFGLLAIQFLAVGPKTWFHLDERAVLLRRAARQRPDRLQPRLRCDTSCCRSLTLTVQIIAEWSRFQRASMLDVMSADYIRTARAKGVPRRKVIVQARVAQRADPARHRDGARHRRAVRRRSSSPRRSSRSRAWAACSSTRCSAGDAPVLVAWTIVTAIFVVLFNLLADVLYGVLDPRIRLS